MRIEVYEMRCGSDCSTCPMREIEEEMKKKLKEEKEKKATEGAEKGEVQQASKD